MFFIPTRNRPDLIKELISAIESTGCVPDAAVMIDGAADIYQDVCWPANWHIHQSDEHLELAGALNALFKLYPNEKTYGFITDHGRPESANWASELEKTAGDWGIALCNDYHNRIHPKTGNRRITEATCFGGELIRELGYVWPDFVIHLYGDDVLEEIGHELGLVTCRDDIKVRSLQFSKGEIQIDENHKRMFRGKPYAADDQEAYLKWRGMRKQGDLKRIRDKMPGESITFACVKWGALYGADYVNILCNAISRNLPQRQKAKFVCFTDDAEGINKEIETRPLPEGLCGWWNKLYLFKDGVFEDGQRVIFFDLDTIIVGALDDIVKYRGNFALLRDFLRPDGSGSGVMLWRAGYATWLWDNFEALGFPEIEGGDQAWIEQNIDADLLQQLYPQAFVSYKVHCQEIFPRGAKVVCFHGEPKPHNAGGWVDNVWKLDGDTVTSLDLVVNSPDITENIKSAIKLPFPLLVEQPEHDGHAVIIGGAASLASTLESIKQRAENGQHVFALNNTYRYLCENGINPDYHVMLDARPENAAFVPDDCKALYASQCHPKVFEKVSEATIWHTATDGIQEVIDGRESTLIGGGSTVGLRAMVVAYVMGYRKIHVYGMDSSYHENEHHAYEQDLNNNEHVIDVVCNGVNYKAAPWMVNQAEEFKDLACQLTQMGCVLTVHGTGLIPDLARTMSSTI